MFLNKTAGVSSVVLLWIGMAVTTRGQRQINIPPNVVTAIADTRRLSVTISTDRDIYVGGEDAVITVTVLNPTSGRLKVLQPFNLDTGGIDLLKRNLVDPQHRPWLYLVDHPFSEVGFGPSTPLANIEPGEKIEKRFHSYDAHFDGDSAIMRSRAVPVKEGEYQLQYAFGRGARTTFTVVIPKLDKLVTVPLSNTQDVKLYNGKHVALKRHVWVFELSTGREYIVGAALSASTDHIPLNARADGLISESDLQRLSPYIRIATLPAAIQSLEATAAPNEDITVKWVDVIGRQSIVVLDPQRNPKHN
jgi:hypothetical protein